MTEKTAADEADTPDATPEVVQAYKGFGIDWKCRDFQYEVGQSYEHTGPVAACNGGFHACEYPLGVLRYYPPAGSRFAIVEQSGDLSRHSEDTKVASRHITVKAEISLPGLIQAAIDWTFSKSTKEAGAHTDNAAASVAATGYRGAASATGDSGAASATGYSGAASATGDSGAASATGDSGAASATGDSGAASATGTRGAASATGYSGAASATGDSGAASATGDSSAASAQGDSGAAATTGDRCLAFKRVTR